MQIHTRVWNYNKVNRYDGDGVDDGDEDGADEDDDDEGLQDPSPSPPCAMVMLEICLEVVAMESPWRQGSAVDL